MEKSIQEISRLGKAYEQNTAKTRRREQGIFYTSAELAAEVVKTALKPLLAARNSAEEILALTVCDPAVGAGIFLLEACRQIAEHLSEKTGASFPEARKIVAQKCLLGVDRDPAAIHVARESLALFTGMNPADFDCLKHADSLKSWNDPAIFPAVGVDLVVGNPPFLGGRKIRRTLGDDYFDFLTKEFAPGASGNADLSAFFLRLADKILRPGGVCGFITTNTVAEGDSRKTGLEFLVNERHAEIFHARNHLAWEGDASVHVAVIHLRFPGDASFTEDSELAAGNEAQRSDRIEVENGSAALSGHSRCASFPAAIIAEKFLDGVRVPRISPSLQAISPAEAPRVFPENKTLCFQGHVLAGKGFLLTAEEGRAFLEKAPRNREVIFPYFTGEEVFHQPTLEIKRMVIHFQDRPLAEAEEFPEILEILRENVLPVRKNVRRKRHREMWWKFGDSRPTLERVLKENAFSRIIIQTRHSKHFSPVFVETGFPWNAIFSESTVVFPSDSFLFYAILNSSPHEIWARRTGSSLGRELRYTPTRCFDTFPFSFPADVLRRDELCPPEAHAQRLRSLGRELHEFRGEMRREKGLSIVRLYDLFHDPRTEENFILGLRELHRRINRAATESFRMTPEFCEFFGSAENYAFRQTPRGIRWGISEEMENRLVEEFLVFSF